MPDKLPDTCADCGAALNGSAKFCSDCGAAIPQRSPNEANLRTLTLMFVDLAGSTAMASSLDPEDHDKWLTSFQDVATDTLLAFEGVPLQHYGDGLLVCFGLTQDSENAAAAAILCALALQKTVAQALSGAKTRIGIHSGEVYCKLGASGQLRPSVTGFDVNLTARIQQEGQPDDVLISIATKRFTERIAVLHDVDIGDITLKGAPSGTQLFRVLDCRIRDEVSRETQLLERDATLQTILGNSDQNIIVTGPAGIGKTAILTQIEGQLSLHANILNMNARANLRHTPLFPLVYWLSKALGYSQFPIETADIVGDPVQDLKRRLDHLLETDLSSNLPNIADALMLAVPASSLGDFTGGQLRLARIQAIITVIQALAAKHPVVLMFDDFQWADPDSVTVIKALSNTDPTLCRLILASRPTALLNELVSDANKWREIPLLPLSEAAASEILQQGTQSGIPKNDHERAIELAEGNPLFLRTMAQAILNNTGTEPVTLPQTIEATFQGVINMLGADKKTILQAAILGRKFSFRHLQLLTGAKSEWADRLSILEQNGLVTLENDAASFSHILVRDAAYSMIPKAQRTEWHGKFARALQKNDPELCQDFPEILAEHALASEDSDLIVQSCVVAGKVFLQRAVIESAVTFLTHAVTHLKHAIDNSQEPNDSELISNYIDTLSLLANAQVQRFGFSHQIVEQSYNELEKVVQDYPQNTFAKTKAYYGLFAYQMIRGRVRSCWQYEKKMIVNIDPSDQRQQLLHLVNQTACSLYSGRFSGVLSTNTRIHKLYNTGTHGTLFLEIGADPLISALTAEIHVYAYQGNLTKAQKTLQDALAHAELIGADLQKPWILIFGAAALFYGGDRETAQEHVAKGIQLADKQGAAFWSLVGRIWALVFEIETDHNPRAIEALEELMLQLDGLGSHLGRPMFLAVLGSGYSSNGNVSKSAELLSAAARRVSYFGEGIWGAEIWDKRLLIALKEDDIRNARKALNISRFYAERADASRWIERAEQREKTLISR